MRLDPGAPSGACMWRELGWPVAWPRTRSRAAEPRVRARRYVTIVNRADCPDCVVGSVGRKIQVLGEFRTVLAEFVTTPTFACGLLFQTFAVDGRRALQAGYTLDSSNSSCVVLCPAGHSCAGGSADPEPCTCDAGYYSDAGVVTACGGSTSTCKPCAAGYMCAGGAEPPASCQCSPGYYSEGRAVSLGCAGMSGACAMADAGSYAAGGHGQMLPCLSPVGRFCASASTTSDGSGCPPGQACAGGAAQPVPCTCR